MIDLNVKDSKIILICFGGGRRKDFNLIGLDCLM